MQNHPVHSASTESEVTAKPLQVWFCKIGGKRTSLPSGADFPMRAAIAKAYREITGEDADFIFSGWAGELTEPELAAVENRLPSPEYEAKWHAK